MEIPINNYNAQKGSFRKSPNKEPSGIPSNVIQHRIKFQQIMYNIDSHGYL